MTLSLFFSLLPMCFAHMSMQFPRYRDRDAAGNPYEQWELNEPMIPARPTVCHGLPTSAVPAENRFSANQIITVELHGTVPHNGGHCSFWYSTNDVDFTKIVDIKDCTLAASIQVQIPDTLPTECGTKCTFAWTWVPGVSGLCEIYNNCADIQVSGLTGKVEANPQIVNFQNLIDNDLCQRVDSERWSNTFRPLKLSGTFEPTTTTTRVPTAPTTTTTRVPSPTPPPVTGTGIKITNSGTLGKWWYAATLDGITAGHTVEYMMVESQGTWTYCDNDVSAGYTVYQCQPGSNGFLYPLGVRFVSNIRGETISASGIILNPNTNAVFYSGINFNGGATPSTTTTAAPAPTTSTTISSTVQATTTTKATTTTTAAPAPTTSTTVAASTTTNPATTSTGTTESILLTTQGSPTDWFYSCELTRVATGFTISSMQILYSGTTKTCRDGGFTGRLVFLCDGLSKALEYPISVKIEANGQTLEIDGAIQNNNANAQFDLGVNFGSGTIQPTTTTTVISSTDAASTSSTKASTSGPSTTSTTAVPPTSTTISSTTAAPPSTVIPTAAPAPTVSTAKPTPAPTNRPTRATTSTDKEIIGYYPAWQWYDRSKLAAPGNLDFSKLTIVNFAFFQPDVNGNLFGTDQWADPQVLFGSIDWNGNDPARRKCHYYAANTQECNYHVLEEGLIHLVHAAGAKIFPSIGGWTLSDNFPVIAASATARQNFADQCVKLIQEYGFDGIDIDWEYPGYAAHSGTAADTENFNKLLQAVRTALDTLGNSNGKYYQLTAALPCGPTLIDNIDVQTVTALLDQLNLMTYDFFGSWDSTVGVNAPLYAPNGVAADKTEFNVASCVANWKAGGATDDKINIGLPFYGRSFAGATQLNQLHSGNDKAHWPDDEGIPQYFNIEKKLNDNSLTSIRDEQSKTQVAHFAGGGVVSFDDQRAICDKVDFVLKNSLNGFIIWEITGDVREDLTTPLLDEVNMKLKYPTTHSCGGSSAFMNEDKADERESQTESKNQSEACLVYLSVSLFTVIINLVF